MIAIKFMKIDLRVTRSQFKIILIFYLLALFILLNNKDAAFVLNYLNFGILIISSTPFILENVSQAGFLNLLPASSSSRVRGRFLYFLCLLLSSQLFSYGILFLVSKNSFNSSFLSVSFISLSFSILTGGLQYLMFYMVGNIKSQQLLSFIRMLPAFLFFFLMNLFPTDGTAISENLKFIFEHMFELSFVLLALCFLLYMLCMYMSNRIYRKKDI